MGVCAPSPIKARLWGPQSSGVKVDAMKSAVASLPPRSLPLVARLHVDLCRCASAFCRP
ncbi:putative leader peptide [Streptomyces sp. NPDC006132]|uniref:putative leader peptide n=1 Tax=Streptomyces sp. NPDC006132 TaxID=3156732 RepID=UPI003407FFF1